MRRVPDLRQIEPRAARPAAEAGAHAMLPSLAGHVLQEAMGTAPAGALVWSRAAVRVTFIRLALASRPIVRPTHAAARPAALVAGLVRSAALKIGGPGARTVRLLRPVRSGHAYRIASLPARGLVTPELAEALEMVFEHLARERGFRPEEPLAIRLSRGFAAGSYGHSEGRAADIDAVGGKSILEWKREWDQAVARAEAVADPQQQASDIVNEKDRNLGYRLYSTLLEHGGWRVDLAGWRVYRGVTQLFGPWTATDGPWKPMDLKNPTHYQRLRLGDQQWVYAAHGDHIHVAK